MPIAKLFVEGKLDFEVLLPILGGSPALQQGGSKASLKPRALTERRENKTLVGYLRDRDFDFDPPIDLSQPTVDYQQDTIPIGWRWCRHEMENYLLDPVLVGYAMSWPVAEIKEVICNTARKIRNYEAARWTIGTVRRGLPPNYELQTRPEELNDVALPLFLDDLAAIRDWASTSIMSHRNRIIAITDPQEIERSFDYFVGRFNDAFVANVAEILIWFSGKDILAGMAAWLNTKTIQSPSEFRNLLRDWVIANPEQTLEILPEWKKLIAVLRA